MAPRTRTRKPLADANHNPRTTRVTRAADNHPIKPDRSQKHAPPSPVVEAPDHTDNPDHPDIDHITSQLESTNISTDAQCTAPPSSDPHRNPFGGQLPSSAPLALPKRPLTAYQHFCKLSRPDICQQHPDANFAEINAMLGAAWKALSVEQRTQYEQSVADDRLRYDNQMSHFKEQQHLAEKERLAIQFYEKELKIQKALEFYDKHLAEQKHAADKPPVAPKQPRKAYNFFVAARFKETGGNSVFGLTAKIAEEWRALQTSRKKKDKTLLASFIRLAAEDEQRYQNEMEAYNAALAEQADQKAQQQQQFKKAAMEAYEASLKDKEDAEAFRKMQATIKESDRKQKKAAKEARAGEPKRPKNAYAIFFSALAAEVSEYIKENNVEHSMAKEIADRWKALSQADKAPYMEEAKKDRERYKTEMDAFCGAQK